MFSSEEYLNLEDSEAEDDNVDGFLSTDDEEDLPIYVRKYTRPCTMCIRIDFSYKSDVQLRFSLI